MYRSRYDKPPLTARCCHVANDFTNFTGDKQTNRWRASSRIAPAFASGGLKIRATIYIDVHCFKLRKGCSAAPRRRQRLRATAGLAELNEERVMQVIIWLIERSEKRRPQFLWWIRLHGWRRITQVIAQKRGRGGRVLAVIIRVTPSINPRHLATQRRTPRPPPRITLLKKNVLE